MGIQCAIRMRWIWMIYERGFFAHSRRQSSFFCAPVRIYALDWPMYSSTFCVDLSSSLIFLRRKRGNSMQSMILIFGSRSEWRSIDWFYVEMANKVKCFDAFKIFLIEMKCRMPGNAKLSKSTQTVKSYHNFGWKSIIITFLTSFTSMAFTPDIAAVWMDQRHV